VRPSNDIGLLKVDNSNPSNFGTMLQIERER
jgi:hypothetical protein